MGTYSAAKAWATVFSEAVATQLAPYGVRVTAVCPGFVHTEFHGRGGMDMSALPEWGWLDADDLVAEALADLAKGKVVSVPSKRFAGLAFALRHLPRSLVRKGSGAVQRRRTHG